MRKENYKIKIGDVLYEPSIMYDKVIKHRIVSMFMEEYVSGWKTMIVTESYLGLETKFSTDVTKWFDTFEEAKENLKKHHRKTLSEVEVVH